MEKEVKQLQRQIDSIKADIDTLKLRSLMGSMEELSPKEKKKRADELERVRKEKGEQGVQKFLLKKFGFWTWSG